MWQTNQDLIHVAFFYEEATRRRIHDCRVNAARRTAERIKREATYEK
jgi:hypothetical protein